MKVNELSKRTGIHLETIRYYEKQGVLPEPKRQANGYRSYDEESITQLIFIKNCRTLGFSLEDIKVFLQSIAIKGKHSEDECKAIAGLQAKIKETV